MGLIDIHCHILPGIDDGSNDIEESLEMARIAKADGISHIFATPHIMDGAYDNRAEDIAIPFTDLKNRLPEGLTLFYGADVRICPDIIKRIEEGNIPTLNGSSYLMLELPAYTLPPHIDNLIFNLRQRKIIPIITHPERHAILMKDISALARFRGYDAMFQITAMSLTGDFGREVQKASLAMIEAGLADFVATDAHDPKKRPPILSMAYEEVKRRFDNDTAEKLFLHNPRKIMEAAQWIMN
ncbi:MAG: hypothetical protein HZA06_07510 [Nitrospirae bacterium]|nr:hypothetical protein [Nitrospirota bacterium]